MQPCGDYLVRVIATGLSALPFVTGAARAEIVAGVSTSGGIEYSTNPYLLNSEDTSAIRGRVSLSPFIEERTARSSLRVSADASFSAFSRRYREAVDLSSRVDYRNTLTRQLSVRAGVSLDSSIGGGYSVAPLFAPTAPDPAVAPQIVDITVIGSEQRSTQVSGTAGATYAPDSRNSFNLDISSAVSRFPGGGFARSAYSSVSESLGYSRVINSRMSVGASVSVAQVNYFGGPLGDAVTISPSINGNMRINAQWSLGAGVGLSSSRVQTFVGRLTSNNLSGNFNLCRKDVRTDFCLNASRGTSASAFQGLSTSTSVGANYSYRLNARDTLSASGGYSRSSAEVALTGNEAVDFLTGNVGWSRRFSDRISGSLSGGFNRSGFVQSRSNAFASIAISYNFGRR